MNKVTTFVCIGAHTKDLFSAMSHGQELAPVTWQLANEPARSHSFVRQGLDEVLKTRRLSGVPGARPRG